MRTARRTSLIRDGVDLTCAFVVPRCGHEVNGGAEQLCLQVAERLARRMSVEILTTCALDYMTWENHYAPGEERIGSLIVRRFPVAEVRDVAAFNALSEQLVSRKEKPTATEQEAWMRAQGPWSPAMLEYLDAHHERYDAFVFLPYLYATTYFGLPKVANRALLAPLAHDEWTIHLPMWDAFFELPRGFIFQTLEERDFLRRRFPRAQLEGPVLGVGVEAPNGTSAERFKKRYLIQSPFLIYVGRIDPSKGCDVMFSHFLALKQRGYTGKLVLLGRAWMPIPDHPDIVSLGFIEESAKWDAIAAADWLIVPSPYESLSIVLLEAWAVGTPTISNADCAVLVGQSRRSNAGLWYQSVEEFCRVVQSVDAATRQQLGAQGAQFVAETYRWSHIESMYIQLLAGIAAS